MKIPIRLLALGPALIVALASRLAGQTNGPQEGHWACESAPGEPTMYATAVWDETADFGEVTNGFGQLLLTKYGYKGAIFCGRANMGGSTLAGVTAGKQQEYDQYRKQGKKVVETGWTFTPATASVPYFCSAYVQVQKAGQSTGYLYLNKAFQVPGHNQQWLSVAWGDYLKTLHPGFLFNPASCRLVPPDPAVQQSQMNSMLDQYKPYNPEIVHLDWTWQPVSAAAAAAATAEDEKPAYYCQMFSGDNQLWYVSGVYPLEGAWSSTVYAQSWLNYFRQVLKLDPNKFHGGCDTGGMKAAQEARGARKEQLNGQAGTKVYEVDWKYTPGEGAAAATAAPAPSTAAPASHAPAATVAPASTTASASYYCQYYARHKSGQVVIMLYQTEVFTSSTPQTAINLAWRQHLTDSYHPDTPVRGSCNRLPPNPAQQQVVLDAMANAAQGSKLHLVKVEWRP